MARELERQGEAGGSMVEFAIVAPVLVMLVMYASFFWDAMHAKIKTQEAANFFAWELTSLPMADYSQGGGGGHAGLLNAAKAKVQNDFTTRYKSLDSANPDVQPSFIANHKLAGNTGNVNIVDEAVPIVSQAGLSQIPGVGGLGGQAAQFANKGLDFALGYFDFDQNGLVTVKVQGQLDDVILKNNFLDSHFGNTPLTPLNQITFKEQVALVVDDWAVNDGADVNLKHASGPIWGTRGSTGQTHPMAAEVNRMAFMGVNNLIPGLGALEGMIPLPNPLAVPVASYNYWKTNNPGTPQGPNCVNNTYGKHGCIDLGKGSAPVEGRKLDVGYHNIQTMPIRTTNNLAANNSSASHEVFKESGPWYMGCPDSEGNWANYDKLNHAACHHQ